LLQQNPADCGQTQTDLYVLVVCTCVYMYMCVNYFVVVSSTACDIMWAY